MSSPEAVWVLCRFAQDSALIFLWGMSAYLAWCVPAPLSGQLARRLDGIAVLAAGTATVATAGALPMQAALIGSGWTDALDASVLWAVLTQTDAGFQWRIEIAGCCGLVAIASLMRSGQMAAFAVVSGGLLTALALNGHAAMHGGPLGLLHRLNDVVHVLAGGAWVGALVPFLVIMGRCNVAESRAQAMLALRRFSNFGHGAVALVLVSGLLKAAFVLGRLPVDWRSPYQMKLMLKFAAVLAMTSLAIANRYILVPRLRVGSGWELRALISAAIAEIGLGLAAIALVAAFGTEDPA